VRRTLKLVSAILLAAVLQGHYAQTSSAEGSPLSTITLGKRLFSDTILSADKSLACASCHRPEHGFSDSHRTSVGIGSKVGRRNVPALLNLQDPGFFFWDGRETLLSRQVLRPISDPIEMGLPLEDALSRLGNDSFYNVAFPRLFPDGITPANLGRSLSDYVRTIRATDSPADRYLQGRLDSLDPLARHGEELFFGKASCFGCHSGPDFTDRSFHNTGVSWGKGDLGRQAITEDKRDCGAFKTATLREVAKTAPYMHDGSFQTLDEVLLFYNRGGNPNPCQDPRIHPLNLGADDLAALKAFLESIQGTIQSGVQDNQP
jgi:cytochrome c peroxidase